MHHPDESIGLPLQLVTCLNLICVFRDSRLLIRGLVLEDKHFRALAVRAFALHVHPVQCSMRNTAALRVQ